jgi:hypothetical protein
MVLLENINPAEMKHLERNPFDAAAERQSFCAGAYDRRYAMRDEFASKSFLAVTVTGLVLLCSGLMAFAFT